MVRIRLNSAVSLTSTESGVVLRSGLGDFTLEGRDVELFVNRILPLLDGTRDQNEVANALPNDLRPSVFAFLDLLTHLGLLEMVLGDADDPRQFQWADQERFFRIYMKRPRKVTRQLNKLSVLIVGLEPWGVAVASELAASGIGTLHILDEGYVAPADLLSVRAWHTGLIGRLRREALVEVLATAAPWCKVVSNPLVLDNEEDLCSDMLRGQWSLVIGAVAPDNLDQQLKLARFSHRAGLISLWGALHGPEAFIGPVVIPGETACWNCCRLRLLTNSDHPRIAHALQKTQSAQRPTVPLPMTLAPMAPLAGHLLALEALKHLSGYAKHQLLGRLLIHNMLTLETTSHEVVPMPWCEVCGGARATRRRKGTSDQLLGARTPEDLRQLLTGWVDSRTGVISHLVVENREPPEPKLPVVAKALFSIYTESTHTFVRSEGSGGKGLTSTEAMIGAVGEAIERYSASRVHLGDLHHSPLQDLIGDVLDPRQLSLYEEAQYERPSFPFVRFDPDRSHWWILGRWMDTNESVYVPALPAFYHFPSEAEDSFCQVTTNGLAAGLSLEDASLRAVFELVERDAFMLTWLCRQAGRRIIIDDAFEPATRKVIEQLQECGAQIELYLLNVGVSSIPTIVCLGLGDGQRWAGVTVSTAAHISPRVAIRKAVLEQGFSGPYLRRVVINREHPIPERPEQIQTFLDHALFYAPAARATAFDFLRLGDDSSLSLASLPEPAEISLQACTERLAADGVHVAIVDVTAPDVAQGPFRVVRALGRDLQPIHCGFGLERLQNPRLKALSSGEVNSDPHPLC